MELAIVESEIVGSGGFDWEDDRIQLLIKRGQIQHGDFVWLDYEEQNTGTIRYGTMLFELQKATKLVGWFVGYAPEAVQKIIAGSIILSKIDNQH